MDNAVFKEIVIEHKNAVLLIGAVLLLVLVAAFLVVECLVRRRWNIQWFSIKKVRFSPSLLLLIPLMCVVTWVSVVLYRCYQDIENEVYVTYVGEIDYTTESVKLCENGDSIYAGKHHDLVPSGRYYGKIVYSKQARVIVYWEELHRASKGLSSSAPC